jgi:hypothetical protein
MASLLYGSGLRLMECVRLRVKDVDFGYGQITVRDGKGEKDRRTCCRGPWPGRSGVSLSGCGGCTKRTWRGATGESIYRTRCGGSTLTNDYQKPEDLFD